MKHHTMILKRLGACPGSLRFSSRHISLDATWAACKHPDWLLWLAARVGSLTDWRSVRITLCLAEPLVDQLDGTRLHGPARNLISLAGSWVEARAMGDPSAEPGQIAHYAAFEARDLLRELCIRSSQFASPSQLNTAWGLVQGTSVLDGSAVCRGCDQLTDQMCLYGYLLSAYTELSAAAWRYRVLLEEANPCEIIRDILGGEPVRRAMEVAA